MLEWLVQGGRGADGPVDFLRFITAIITFKPGSKESVLDFRSDELEAEDFAELCL
jgi:hypothetical protein